MAKIEDINKDRPLSPIKYDKPIQNTIFNDRVIFEEVYRQADYFAENKQGLKASIVLMPPETYMQVVEEKQELHKLYGPDQSKLSSIKEVCDAGIQIDIPMLRFGDRDEHSNAFGQEGYNRAAYAKHLGYELIAVDIRYRDCDRNIPDYIKTHIDNSQAYVGLRTENFQETKAIDYVQRNYKNLLNKYLYIDSNNPSGEKVDENISIRYVDIDVYFLEYEDLKNDVSFTMEVYKNDGDREWKIAPVDLVGEYVQKNESLETEADTELNKS